MQELIFTRRPRLLLSGNLLCRIDWLSVRPSCRSWRLSLVHGAAAAGKAFQGSAPRRVGPCRPTLEATHSTERTHVCFGLVCARLSRLRTAVCPNCSHSGATTWRSGWHGRSWTADALCRLHSDCAPAAREEDRPFLPRFLLQEIIFAHSPYEGDLHNRPRLQGNLLCRSEWLHPRGISETECMILRVQELAASPRCRAAQRRGALLGVSVLVGPTASRRIPLPVRSNALLWELGQNRQPLLGAHRHHLRLGARPLEAGFGCGWGSLPSSSWTSASGTIPATASSPRAYPCSRPLSTTDGRPLTR